MLFRDRAPGRFGVRGRVRVGFEWAQGLLLGLQFLMFFNCRESESLGAETVTISLTLNLTLALTLAATFEQSSELAVSIWHIGASEWG